MLLSKYSTKLARLFTVLLEAGMSAGEHSITINTNDFAKGCVHGKCKTSMGASQKETCCWINNFMIPSSIQFGRWNHFIQSTLDKQSKNEKIITRNCRIYPGISEFFRSITPDNSRHHQFSGPANIVMTGTCRVTNVGANAIFVKVKGLLWIPLQDTLRISAGTALVTLLQPANLQLMWSWIRVMWIQHCLQISTHAVLEAQSTVTYSFLWYGQCFWWIADHVYLQSKQRRESMKLVLWNTSQICTQILRMRWLMFRMLSTAEKKLVWLLAIFWVQS